MTRLTPDGNEYVGKTAQTLVDGHSLLGFVASDPRTFDALGPGEIHQVQHTLKRFIGFRVDRG